MDNPLELPAPDDPIQCIQTLARDLAYGAVHRIWNPAIMVVVTSGGEDWISETEEVGGQINPFYKYLKDKWGDKRPSINVLLSFGYCAILEQKQYQTDYILTPKAYALLEKPASPPSVFISYRQAESSALALLIEARLKIADSNISVFIDKLLQGGDDWKDRLEKTIRQSRYFICLISRDTLAKSSMVHQEVEWAWDAGCTLISICHNGYKIDDNYPEKLQGKQAIKVEMESAKGYESAVNDLLNSLGYSTY